MIVLPLPIGPALPQTWLSAFHCRDQYSALERKAQNEICPSALRKASYFLTQRTAAAVKRIYWEIYLILGHLTGPIVLWALSWVSHLALAQLELTEAVKYPELKLILNLSVSAACSVYF